MSPAPLRILGLDPGLRKTGWGVIRVEGNRLSHLGHGVIAPNEKAPFSERLLALFDGISAVVADWTPDEAAIEETFMNTNAASALKLGHARAAALLAPAKAGLPVRSTRRGWRFSLAEATIAIAIQNPFAAG